MYVIAHIICKHPLYMHTWIKLQKWLLVYRVITNGVSDITIRLCNCSHFL